jgi:hypothetical protein
MFHFGLALSSAFAVFVNLEFQHFQNYMHVNTCIKYMHVCEEATRYVRHQKKLVGVKIFGIVIGQ